MVVDNGGSGKLVLQLCGNAHGNGGVLHNALEGLGDGGAELTVISADAAGHDGLVGNGVVALAGVHGTNSQDQGVQGIIDAGNEGLQVHDDGSGSHQGVAAQMGVSAVGGNTVNGEGEAVAAGHAAAGLEVDVRRLQAAPDVLAHDSVHALQDLALFHVPHHAAGSLLGGLEEQADLAAGESVLVLHQDLGGAQERGDVTVVAAGVHHALVDAGKVVAGLLGNGKGVDIGAQQNGLAGLAGIEIGVASGLIAEADHIIAHLLQLLLDLVGGLEFLPAELGMLVEPSALFDNVILGRLSGILEIHRLVPFCSMERQTGRRWLGRRRPAVKVMWDGSYSALKSIAVWT